MSDPWNNIPGNPANYPANIRAAGGGENRSSAIFDREISDLADRTEYLRTHLAVGRVQSFASANAVHGADVSTTSTLITAGAANGGVLVLNTTGASDSGANGRSIYEVFDIDPLYTTSVYDVTTYNGGSPTGPALAIVGGGRGVGGISHAQFQFVSGAWIVVNDNHNPDWRIKQAVSKTTVAVAFDLNTATYTPVLNSGSVALGTTVTGLLDGDRVEVVAGPFGLGVTATDNAALELTVVQNSVTTTYEQHVASEDGTLDTIAVVWFRFTLISAGASSLSIALSGKNLGGALHSLVHLGGGSTIIPTWGSSPYQWLEYRVLRQI